MGRKYENEQTKIGRIKLLLFYYRALLHFVALAIKRKQCSPFLSAQQEKEFFKLTEHLRESVLIMSAQCIYMKKIVWPVLLNEYKDHSYIKQK